MINKIKKYNFSKNKYEDPRTTRTRQALHDALCNKLTEKSLQQISISEITSDAKVNRSTFYLHYSNLVDLYSEIEEFLFQQYKIKLEEYIADIKYAKPNNHDFEAEAGLLTETFIFLKEHQKYIPVILANSSDNRLLERIAKLGEQIYLLKWKFDNPITEKLEIKYSYTYMISGLISIFKKWLEDGTIESPKDMTNITFKMIYRYDLTMLNEKNTVTSENDFPINDKATSDGSSTN